MIKNQSLFPVFLLEICALGGVAIFKEIKALFLSPKKQISTSWNVYFALVADTSKLVRILSENFSLVVLFCSPNDITVDNYKW